MFAATPPENGAKERALFSEAIGRGQMRSTMASPKQRVRTRAGYLSAPVAAVTEETIELDDQPVFLRRAGDDEVPILYLHGIPTSSFDWLAPLALGGGIAVDLPGFGRSGKRGDLDYSLDGHVAFVERLLERLEIERVRLCGHDWGAAVGLRWAMSQPERVERLVVVDGVPLLAGFRWRGPARLVRMPLVGPGAVRSAGQ